MIITDVCDKLELPAIEQQLSEHSSKTCDLEKFQAYISHRNALLQPLSDKYADPRFRKYKFRQYINRERSKSKLILKIKDFFKADSDLPPILVYGDWSASKQMKGTISTPGIGLKRFLAKHFTTYNIDEFRTSILHHQTHTYCKNLYLKDPKIPSPVTYKKLHSVLTSTMENGRLGCINRDRNAVYNMKNIVTHIFDYGTYPDRFLRSTIIS